MASPNFFDRSNRYEEMKASSASYGPVGKANPADVNDHTKKEVHSAKATVDRLLSSKFPDGNLPDPEQQAVICLQAVEETLKGNTCDNSFAMAAAKFGINAPAAVERENASTQPQNTMNPDQAPIQPFRPR